jgi:hypothetical protein
MEMPARDQESIAVATEKLGLTVEQIDQHFTGKKLIFD